MEIINDPLQTKRKDRGTSSFFSEGVRLEGNVDFNGGVRIDCKINGQIKSNSAIYAGRFSEIEGNIDTASFVCEGRFSGTVSASGNIHVTKSGKIAGDICTPEITIEEGGFFEGMCHILKPTRKVKTLSRKKPKIPIPVLDE